VKVKATVTMGNTQWLSISMNRLPAFVIAMALVGAVGCADDEARVAVRYVSHPELAFVPQLSGPTVVVSAPGFRRSLSDDEIGSSPAEISTPTSGTLSVQFLFGTSATALASGTVTVDLAPDRVWSFEIGVASANPQDHCFGCVGARGFALDPSYRRTPTDSVWVVWGRNSIKHPVVF
jgi:hypothetical protein